MTRPFLTVFEPCRSRETAQKCDLVNVGRYLHSNSVLWKFPNCRHIHANTNICVATWTRVMTKVMCVLLGGNSLFIVAQTLAFDTGFLFFLSDDKKIFHTFLL